MGFYDIVVKDKAGEDVSLSAYKGKVLVVVNTATGCGFTPQYEGLQKLYDTYKVMTYPRTDVRFLSEAHHAEAKCPSRLD